jgi:hypothetical protein
MIPTLDQLAETLYKASYSPDADRERIAALVTRPEWEQLLWRRVALSAIETINGFVQAELARKGGTA